MVLGLSKELKKNILIVSSITKKKLKLLKSVLGNHPISDALLQQKAFSTVKD